MTRPRFHIHMTGIAGVAVVERLPIHDERGFFERVFCTQEFAALTQNKPLVQINRTLTKRRGTVRGLHFQYPPAAEIKCVTCLRGELLDVAVDIRAGSPTFLQVHSEFLSADNHKMMVIPAGCAHGFQALTDDCELLYLNTAAHAPELESGLHPTDPQLNVNWSLPLIDLSPRDAERALLDVGFQGILL
ncbi:dTDP-4-dehydrorhamnose 3,5-epimerase [Chromatium okenii]|uniref:dTDP-4-dehydrorhamnose 3,5-epimerase family protein n=1 Tax=Chromatium okenii TaxID=61644 RepID=UPI001907369C|nr:dTDP-4-dehydrorhamnose 3,5-epimerase family protein [Chromatium okenii]MBK1642770.1 dTDP-4-dehydrorhamnose 3,5-epimerase [Chromatium okenii]